MQILIPMAGSGRKFKDAGYKTHQIALPVFDRHTGKKLPMVVCAAMDLPGVEDDGKNIIFVDRTFHKESGIEDRIRRYFPGAKFITTQELTNGQASTCLLAKEYLNADSELLIAGADNGMVCDIDKLNDLRHDCDVIVFTYRHNESVLHDPSAYGWMITDIGGNIKDVSVKRPISENPMNDHAVVSSFWFRTADIFIQAAERMIFENDRINNEFYVDESVKHAIRLGYSAKVFEISRYIGWGTPKDYELYQLTYDYWRGFLDKIDSREVITPFSIGISGDSGSGKSTLLNVFEKIMGIGNVLILEGDGDHKWERNSEEWNKFTHLDVDANNLYSQANNLQLLKNGAAIKRREYDHKTGTFTSEHRYDPKPYVILCGLHSFYLPQNRRNLDLKIYMDIDENLRRFWKVKRDTLERGRDVDEVIKQIESRVDAAERYVEPQKSYADIGIHYYDPNLFDYKDTSYNEEIRVDVELRKEDTICGIIHRVLEQLPYSVEGVSCESDIISFSEREIENIEIPVYDMSRKLDIDMSCFGIDRKSKLLGKDGVLALIMIAYISEKKQND